MLYFLTNSNVRPSSSKGMLKLRDIFSTSGLIHGYASKSCKICKPDTVLDETWQIQMVSFAAPLKPNLK